MAMKLLRVVNMIHCFITKILASKYDCSVACWKAKGNTQM